MTRSTRTLALAAVLASCMGPQTPVPVSGRTEILAGEWAGSFDSRVTGRAGSIVFKLKAGTDSAWGDVVMVYTKTPFSMEPPEPRPGLPSMPASQPIAIAFIACGEGEVTGRLEPYQDPETGERIETTFTGRLVNNAEFRGTFSTYYPISDRRVTGEWSVRRKKAAE